MIQDFIKPIFFRFIYVIQAFSKFRHFVKCLKIQAIYKMPKVVWHFIKCLKKANHFIKCLKYKYIQINQQRIIFD